MVNTVLTPSWMWTIMLKTKSPAITNKNSKHNSMQLSSLQESSCFTGLTLRLLKYSTGTGLIFVTVWKVKHYRNSSMLWNHWLLSFRLWSMLQFSLKTRHCGCNFIFTQIKSKRRSIMDVPKLHLIQFFPNLRERSSNAFTNAFNRFL